MIPSENSRRLYESALADFRHNRLDDASDKLRRALKAAPDFDDAYEALSVVLYNQKKYDEAIDLLKTWSARNPDSIMAQTNLSRCYVAKQMIDEAEQAQAEARRLSWKEELKGKAAVQPKKDFKDRIDRYKQVIELDPADVLGYYSLASTYLEAGMVRDAADTFEKAIEVDPQHSSSFLGLGQALERLGDKTKARSIYERGIKVAGSRGDVMPQRKMESSLRKLADPESR